MNDKYVSKKTRITWIDALRGVLIIMMVFAHNIQYGCGTDMLNRQLFFDNIVFRCIYSFHMPCLMILSGYLFGFSIINKDVWRNKFQSIAVPTITWSIIPVGISTVNAIVKRNLSLFTLLGCLRIMVTYYWFLWAIMFGVLSVWIVHTYLKDSILAYMIFGIVLLFVPSWLNTKLWIFMYPYFVGGYIWNLKKPIIVKVEKHRLAVSLVLISFYIFLFIFYNKESFIYTTGIMVRDTSQLYIDIYRYIIGYVGSVLMIWLFYICYFSVLQKFVVLVKLLTYCGKISLTIYIIDSLINSYILPKITEGFNINYGIVFLETCIIISFCSTFDKILRKYHDAYRILLGGR